jgi:hypothetical protein
MILVGLTMTSFSEKMLISNRRLLGLMPNLIKKSVTVSNVHTKLYYNSLQTVKSICGPNHITTEYFPLI